MRNLIANKTSNFENNYTKLNLNIRPTFFFFGFKKNIKLPKNIVFPDSKLFMGSRIFLFGNNISF